MRNPKTNASSTQIMVRNILVGMKKISQKLIFVAIVTSDCNKQDICSFYQDVVDEIYFVKSFSGKKRGRYGTMLAMFMASFRSPKLSKDLALDGRVLVLSHSPTIDSILYAKGLKRRNPNVTCIQYWSDPITLALETVSEYSYKRAVFKYIESKMLRYADKIVYGTKTLYENQKKFFRKYGKKMGYCDVCYNPLNDDAKRQGERCFFGYIGNFYSNIRDILPFYNAFKSFNQADLLICGAGNIDLEPKRNIKVMHRVPQQEVALLESELNVEVCILNKVGFQIPGKIFYATNTNKKILVILDGPVSEEIYDYLRPFKRFIFCNNNEISIYNILNEIVSGKYDEIDKSELYRLTPEYVARSILNGGFN